jgi:protein-tyrosine sulfotransferase
VASAPIVIVGVPRSGTTLLRVLLDSHSEILALPETPWLLGVYGRDTSLRSVLQGLIEGPYGAVRNVSGVSESDVLAAGRSFLAQLFASALAERNKQRLAFKTPADIRHLDFLTRFMPDAHYVHITRDGRDVALSQLAKRGRFFRDLREYGRLGYANVFRRWVEWEKRVRALLYCDGLKVVHLRYEDLIADPRAELKRITEFIGVAFEPEMLDYASMSHDYPAWEAGSTDVVGNTGISAASTGRWRTRKLTPEMLHTLLRYDAFLVELGYPSSNLEPGLAERTLAAGFPLVRPFLEIAPRLRAWVRRLSAA